MEEEVWQPLQSDDFVAYAIYSTIAQGLMADASTLEDFAVDMQFSMPILTDWDGEIYMEWKIEDPDQYAPYPREFVINKEGRIVYMDADIDVDGIYNAVEAALAE